MGYEDDEMALRAERDRKKEEVRKRLEESSRAKKAKKGFLTPERKKKLRKLLMMKAAEDLKQRQQMAEKERQSIIAQRILPLPDFDEIDEDELLQCALKFVERVRELESDLYDLNYTVRQKDFEINEMQIAVNDLRGKFVKPTLKKVSKTDNQFAKLNKKMDEVKVMDFKANLKTVEKNQFALDEKDDRAKAEWQKQG